MEDKFWYLKNCDLFERLSNLDIKKLESRSKSRKYPRGSLVYLPTDLSDSVLLVLSGRVKIYDLTGEGKQGILAMIDPGEIFGELSILGIDRRNEYAETMEASTIVSIPGNEMQALIEKHPKVSMEVTKLMGLRRQRFERRVKSLLYRSNRDRLVYVLLELVEKYGVQTDEGIRLDTRMTQQDLAGIIGSTRETVTVVLGELQTEGIIRVVKRKIFLTDLGRLAESVDADVPQAPMNERVRENRPNRTPLG